MLGGGYIIYCFKCSKFIVVVPFIGFLSRKRGRRGGGKGSHPLVVVSYWPYTCEFRYLHGEEYLHCYMYFATHHSSLLSGRFLPTWLVLGLISKQTSDCATLEVGADSSRLPGDDPSEHWWSAICVSMWRYTLLELILPPCFQEYLVCMCMCNIAYCHSYDYCGWRGNLSVDCFHPLVCSQNS